MQVQYRQSQVNKMFSIFLYFVFPKISQSKLATVLVDTQVWLGSSRDSKDMGYLIVLNLAIKIN